MATLLRRSALATLTAMALMLIAAPAFAHHKAGHDKGKAAQDTAPVVTEDNDDDGVAGDTSDDEPNTPDPAGDTDNAHPSGNDKSAESGGSGNQGKSGSDPDGMENGGVDKPNGKGGNDDLDQDGNNGCGNDDDFEDDNNGNCGGKAKPPKPPKPPKTEDNPSDDDNPTPVVPTGTTPPPTIVSDASSTGQDKEKDKDGPAGPAGGPATGPGATAAPAVSVTDGELAFTGVNVSTLLMVMSILGLLGAAMVLAARRRA